MIRLLRAVRLKTGMDPITGMDLELPERTFPLLIVEGLSPLQQSPLSFAVIIDCLRLRSSHYEIKTRRTSLIFSILQISFARK